MNLSDFLEGHGFGLFKGVPLDGEYQRGDRRGSLNAWFKGRLTPSGVTVAAFGDWKTKEHHTFCSEVPTEPGARAELQLELDLMAAQEKRDREEFYERTALLAEEKWELAIDRGRTAYLDRKKLAHLHGARICPEYDGTLMVPARDIDGKLWTIQRILPQKLESGIDKFFMKGGKKQGCFFLFGQPTAQAKVIYVCEGYATAASVFEAMGSDSTVVAGFDTGNLEAVGHSLRARHGAVELVFCADNDCWGAEGDHNPGRDAALAASGACQGSIRLPRFRSGDGKPTDWNDLACQEGLEEVRKQIQAGPPKEIPAASPESNPTPKKKKFSEKLVAEWMMERLGPTVARQDRALFRYTGTHWVELDSTGIDQLKNLLNSLCADSLGSRDVDSFFRTFLRYVPHVPEGTNLYQPRRDCANFRNGTLHLSFRPKAPEELALTPGTGTHVFSLEFKPHAPADFCTTVLPLDYQPWRELPENEPFQQMLRNVWPDEHQGDKIKLYEELLGACLVPLFPMVFFFVGVPRSGKSTLLMLMSKLVGEDNTSHSDPTLWGRSFGMEALVGKLVNLDTDISTTRALPDDMLKKVIDGVFSINRKYKSEVHVKLPAVHAFGSNDMPRNAEGGSGAYDRRAVVIRTETPQVGQGGGGGFSTWVWGQGPSGVLRAALRGLERLLSQGGNYTRTETSREELEEWAKENDHLQQFIDAIAMGEIKRGDARWEVHPDACISTQELYTGFVEYVKDNDAASYRAGRFMTSMGLAKKLRRDNRFGSKRTNCRRYATGVGVRGAGGAGY